MPPPAIDPALLRGFVMVAECGSVQVAGHRLGSSAVAISAQLQRLESLLGRQLVTRRRRGIVLTPHGAWLLAQARALLASHDAILTAFRRPRRIGALRLGVPDDYAQPWMTRILGGFAESCPDMAVEVISAGSGELIDQVRSGEIEVAVICNPDPSVEGPECRPLWRGELTWLASQRHDTHRLVPLPLAVAGPRCPWRRAAIAALDAVCQPWRIACTTATPGGGLPLVQAGLAVTVGLPLGIPPGLRSLGPDDGLPRLAEFSLHLLSGSDSQDAVLLARTIEAVFRRTLGQVIDMEVLFGHAA
jgi:DNA-binding transcriptional LysR family regulator